MVSDRPETPRAKRQGRTPALWDVRNALICRLISEGWTEAEVARHLGVRRPTIARVIERNRDKAIAIPAWVPGWLHADYRIITLEDGEEAAASYARNRKRSQVASGSLECGARLP